MRFLSWLLWLFLTLYLLGSAASLALAMYGDREFSGLYLLVLAMPWTLIANPVLTSLGIGSVSAVYVFLSGGILVNAAMVFWAARFLGRL